MRDVLGKAILEFFENDHGSPLFIIDKDGDKEEMEIGTYFRTFNDMPYIEQLAIQACKGKVLEAGAGAGSHALILQEAGIDITALEISPRATRVMKKRGVLKTMCRDIFSVSGQRYDTILLLMNGIGLVSTLSGLEAFLELANSILNNNGQIIFDSSDVSYLFEDAEKPSDHYYGEIEYRYEYRGEVSQPKTWLYIDRHTLTTIARRCNFCLEVLFEDASNHYLARLTRKSEQQATRG